MATRIPIPFVSTNAADVTLVRWCAKPGDALQQGDVLLEVSTDKAAFEIEMPAAGTLLETFASERSVLPIGTIVALIGIPGETDPEIEDFNASTLASYQSKLGADVRSDTPPRPDPSRPLDGTTPMPATSSPPADPGVRATPKVRRLAREHGLDLAAIQAETGASILTERVISPYLPPDNH